MDREIAAGCFDGKMMIFDFRFRNFTHNIPPAEDSIVDSDRTSNIDTSGSSCQIKHEEKPDNAIS